MSTAIGVFCIHKSVYFYFSSTHQGFRETELNCRASSVSSTALMMVHIAGCFLFTPHQMMLHNWGRCLGNNRTPPPPTQPTSLENTLAHKHTPGQPRQQNVLQPHDWNGWFSAHWYTQLVWWQKWLSPKSYFTISSRGSILSVRADVWLTN